MMSLSVTYTRARTREGTAIRIATCFDDDPLYAKRTRISAYDKNDMRPDPRGGAPNHWSYNDFDVCVTSLALYQSHLWHLPLFCALSAEGDLVLLYNGSKSPREKIVGAGIDSADSLGYGRMAYLRQIGKHLYACGDSGQIYRRDDAEFGEGKWTQLDPRLLQKASDRLMAQTKDPSSSDASIKFYFCVNGPSEKEIYICGSHGTILCWDGAMMHEVPSGTTVSLINILVKDSKNIYICGRQGTLLRGNRHDGFKPVLGFSGEQGFTTMTFCRDKLYLGSNSNPRGLFVYDGNSVNRVSCGLNPDIDDVNVIDSADDVLWVVGSKDLLRFDGVVWERINHPDNVPVGSPAPDVKSQSVPQAASPIIPIINMPGFPNEIVSRTNKLGIGNWLYSLFGWLGEGLPQPDAPIDEKVTIFSKNRDVTVTVYRHRETSDKSSWDGWVLYSASFGPRAELPLGLKASSETPQTVAAKLGEPGATAGRRASYFLQDGIVIEITYGANHAGIERVLTVRLGGVSD